MQLTLQEDELHQIVRNHVASLINLNEGTTLEVSIKALRGTDGFTAVVDIVGDGEAPKATVVPKRATRKAALPKAEPEQQQPNPESGDGSADQNQQQPESNGDTTEKATAVDSGAAQESNAVQNQSEQQDEVKKEDPPFDPEAEEAALNASSGKAEGSTPKSTGETKQAVGTASQAATPQTGARRPVFPGFKGINRPGV